MWFGELPISDAAGCVLAHSVRLQDRRIKKGTILNAALLDELKRNGYARLTVARLDENDIAEDSAAAVIANAVASGGVVVDKPHTGRANFFAAQDGLLCFNAKTVLELNSVSEAITLSTLPENTWVLAGRMVATCKIITYAVPQADVDRAVAATVSSKISVCTPVKQTAVLIQTCLPSVKESVLDKTRRVTEDRLNARGTMLSDEYRCDHQIDALSEVLTSRVSKAPDLILIAGASAISDRRDVVPAAIEAAGGKVLRFGLPVDPGNLLLLGALDGTTIIGLPGCARSPKYNGLDQLLDRLACKVAIDNTWLNTLGVGGLMTEMVDRPQPRMNVDPEAVVMKPEIGGLVLAAGLSRRAGDTNKLLVAINGGSMIRTVVDAVCASVLERVVVVTGHDHELVESQLQGTAATTSYCAHHGKGLAHSLSHGISRLGSVDAVMVCLGDMPHVTSDVIDLIIRRMMEREIVVSESIVVPVSGGRNGNPVIVGSAFFDTLLQLTGDSGARTLMQQYPDRVCKIEVDDSAVLIDYDTPEALDSLRDD